MGRSDSGHAPWILRQNADELHFGCRGAAPPGESRTGLFGSVPLNAQRLCSLGVSVWSAPCDGEIGIRQAPWILHRNAGLMPTNKILGIG